MATVVTDPFVVVLRSLRDVHGERRHEVRRGRLGQIVTADGDCRVAADAEAVADVVLESFDGGISVTGVVRAPWEAECRRCLASIDGRIEVEVRELFRRDGSEEEGTYPIEEDHLSLKTMVVDALFTELPVLPLCRPDCRGLCPRCGVDRNLEPCECPETEIDPRWAGLSGLARSDDVTAEEASFGQERPRGGVERGTGRPDPGRPAPTV
jgi:uncharacterized protein